MNDSVLDNGDLTNKQYNIINQIASRLHTILCAGFAMTGFESTSSRANGQAIAQERSDLNNNVCTILQQIASHLRISQCAVFAMTVKKEVIIYQAHSPQPPLFPAHHSLVNSPVLKPDKQLFAH